MVGVRKALFFPDSEIFWGRFSFVFYGYSLYALAIIIIDLSHQMSEIARPKVGRETVG